MHNRLRSLVAVFAIGLCAAGHARAQDGPPTVKPTPEHQVLGKDVGTWDGEIRTWMQGPDSEPTVSKGVETNRMMPGGLWLLSEFRGEFGGMEFNGAGQTGYDPQKKKYVGTWVDSMSAQVTLMEGEFDPKTRTVTMLSKGTEPGTGKPTEMKNVATYEDDGHKTFLMYMKSDETKGQFVKMMEIRYTRRAK